jgi:uncharacterized repeat protein (TIGR02543 family)
MTLNPPFKSWILSLIIVPFLQLGSFSVIQTYALNDYTLTFETNGGNSIEPITAKYGTPLEIPNPTKEGYSFEQWYDNEILSNPVGSTITMPAENLTLYAKWNVNQYTITFNTNGGDIISTQTHNFGSPLVIPTPTRVGHAFGGWFIDSNLTQSYSGSETMPAENLTLYAKWTINQYTISFVSNGGSTIQPITLNFGESVIAPADPTREGYTFNGWYSNIDLTDSFLLILTLLISP